jgi:hypothetical protein
VTDGSPEGSAGLGGWNDFVIDLPDEELADPKRRAQASGLSVEQWARQAIRSYLGLAAPPRDAA